MRTIENGQTRALIHTVRHIVCTCDLLSNTVFLYTAVPKQFNIDEIQKLKLVVSRHGKRCAYYALNFIDNYIKILDEILNLGLIPPATRFIEDNIFFDFDAFAFSCKSIVEGNVVKLAKKFEADIRKDFETYSNAKFNSFIRTYLNPIRDEAVHLNNWGTAMGSIVHVDQNNKLFFQTSLSNDIDLIEMFEKIITELKYIILNISKSVVRHESVLWGKPNKHITFQCGNEKLTIVEILGNDIEKYF